MKKIEFGFNDDDKLNSQWAGIEFYNGEYLDMFACEDMDFLVTRIVDSYRGLNGKIDVREITQDYYSDGGCVTYANMEKNRLCQKLSEYLNSSMAMEKIAKGKTPYEILRDEDFPVYMSHLADVTSKSDIVPAVVTSIKHDVFQKLKDSKRITRGMSMYDLSEEIRHLREEINRLKNNSQEFGSGRRI